MSSSVQLLNDHVSRATLARGIDGVSKGGASDMKERHISGCQRKENRARFIKVLLVSALPFYYMLNVDLGIRGGVRTSRGALSRHSPHAGHCYPPPPLSNVSTFFPLPLLSLSPLLLLLSLSLSLSIPLLPFWLLPRHSCVHLCYETPNEPRTFSAN